MLSRKCWHGATAVGVSSWWVEGNINRISWHWWPCLHTCSQFLPLQERSADPHGPRKIRCREGFGREKVGGECWEVGSMESTRMTRPEWLGVSWVTALNWLTAVNSQQLLPEVLLLSSLKAVPYHLVDVLHCLFQQLIRLNPLHVRHCGRLQNLGRELKRQKY